MINSLKSNRALRGNRKSAFEHIKEHDNSKGDKLQFKKPTATEMENFRREWADKVEALRKKRIMAIGISVVIISFVVYGFINFLS